jgi:hypothetical protein
MNRTPYSDVGHSASAYELATRTSSSLADSKEFNQTAQTLKATTSILSQPCRSHQDPVSLREEPQSQKLDLLRENPVDGRNEVIFKRRIKKKHPETPDFVHSILQRPWKADHESFSRDA